MPLLPCHVIQHSKNFYTNVAPYLGQINPFIYKSHVLRYPIVVTQNKLRNVELLGNWICYRRRMTDPIAEPDFIGLLSI